VTNQISMYGSVDAVLAAGAFARWLVYKSWQETGFLHRPHITFRELLMSETENFSWSPDHHEVWTWRGRLSYWTLSNLLWWRASGDRG